MLSLKLIKKKNFFFFILSMVLLSLVTLLQTPNPGSMRLLEKKILKLKIRNKN